MTTQHNFGPVGIIGSTVADRPDPRLLPLGEYFVSELDGRTFFVTRNGIGVHVWKEVLGAGGGGGSPVGFVVGPAGSGAQFTTFASAIAAALLAGISTVMFLSGRYAAEPVINLPAGISLQPFGAEEFTAIIIADIVTNAPFSLTRSVQALRGFVLQGTITCGPLAGPATNAIVTLTDMQISSPAGHGIRTLNDGWTFVLKEADINVPAGSRDIDANGSVSIDASRSNFGSVDRPPVELGNGGSARFENCFFRGPANRISNVAASLNFTNTIFELLGSPSYVIDGFAGSTVSINGTFVQQGLAAAGMILDPLLGTLQIGMGVDLGELKFSSRPVPPSANIMQGVTAYFFGMLPGGPSTTATEAPVYFAAGFWRRTSDDSVAA